MTDLEKLMETLQRNGETMELEIRDGKICGSKWEFWFEFDGAGKAVDYRVKSFKDIYEDSLRGLEETIKEQSA